MAAPETNSSPRSMRWTGRPTETRTAVDLIQAVGRAAELRAVPTDLGEELAARFVDRIAVVLEDRFEDPFTRAEVVVHRRHVALAGGLRDLAHGDAIEPVPGEQSLRLPEQALLGDGAVARH